MNQEQIQNAAMLLGFPIGLLSVFLAMALKGEHRPLADEQVQKRSRDRQNQRTWGLMAFLGLGGLVFLAALLNIELLARLTLFVMFFWFSSILGIIVGILPIALVRQGPAMIKAIRHPKPPVPLPPLPLRRYELGDEAGGSGILPGKERLKE
jgi:hypothetical protein